MPQEESVLLDINDRCGSVSAGASRTIKRSSNAKLVAGAIALVAVAAVMITMTARKADR